MPSKCGIPRDWSKSEGLSEKASLRSGTNSVSARYVNSVSDLYATDEIDALLDEIRDLEPVSVHTDADFQDFEIDGSVSRLPFDMTCDSRTSVSPLLLYGCTKAVTIKISISGPQLGFPPALPQQHSQSPSSSLLSLSLSFVLCLTKTNHPKKTT
jgi:hypothetical protein